MFNHQPFSQVPLDHIFNSVGMAAAASQTIPTAEQEEEEEKFNEILSSLPKDDGLPLIPLYRYKQFWYPKRLLWGTLLATQSHSKAKDTDVILASTPKAGTTWLKALTYAIINRAHFPPSHQHHPLLSNNPHRLIPFLEELYIHSSSNTTSQSNNIPPSHHPIVSTHIPYSMLPKSVKYDSNCKIVYICRDPKDVVVSLWHFIAGWARTTSSGLTAPIPLEDLCESFCAGVSVFGPFWEHVREYWEASLDEKVLCLKYEDLKRKPVGVVKGLAEFLGYGFTAEEEERGVIEEVVKLCSFEKLSRMEANSKGALPLAGPHRPAEQVEYKLFFRRGEVGDSTNYLTTQMAQRLDRITQEKFQGLGMTIP
ncbi:hypothetical protein ACLOJK_007740 [Asimina triloba]